MKTTTISLALLAVMAGVAYAAPRALHLGFRLELDKRYDPSEPPELSRKRTIEILQKRIGALSDHASIVSNGDTLDVVLPGHNERERAKLTTLVGQAGRLQIAILDDENPAFVAFTAKVKDDAAAKRAGVTVDGARVVGKSADVLYATIKRLGQAPADRRFAVEGPTAQDPSHYRAHLVPVEPAFTNHDVESIESTWDDKSKRPQVMLVFSAEAAKRLEQLTKKAIDKRLAIQVDDHIVSAPVIQTPIVGGRSILDLAGNGTLEQQQQLSRDLVALLQTGALAAPLVALPRK
jgi:preprotein translocase subunit SecD